MLEVLAMLVRVFGLVKLRWKEIREMMSRWHDLQVYDDNGGANKTQHPFTNCSWLRKSILQHHIAHGTVGPVLVLHQCHARLRRSRYKQLHEQCTNCMLKMYRSANSTNFFFAFNAGRHERIPLYFWRSMFLVFLFVSPFLALQVDYHLNGICQHNTRRESFDVTCIHIALRFHVAHS